MLSALGLLRSVLMGTLFVHSELIWPKGGCSTMSGALMVEVLHKCCHNVLHAVVMCANVEKNVIVSAVVFY